MEWADHPEMSIGMGIRAIERTEDSGSEVQPEEDTACVCCGIHWGQ